MLVLSRKVGEQISIGNNITVTVLRTSGNQVRIGIDAPTSISIVRSELQRFIVDTSCESVRSRLTRRGASAP